MKQKYDESSLPYKKKSLQTAQIVAYEFAIDASQHCSTNRLLFPVLQISQPRSNQYIQTLLATMKAKKKLLAFSWPLSYGRTMLTYVSAVSTLALSKLPYFHISGNMEVSCMVGGA
jgi:hypothetical protein